MSVKTPAWTKRAGPRAVPIYCRERARLDVSPVYSGANVRARRRASDRVGMDYARWSAGEWRCNYCGARVRVAW